MHSATHVLTHTQYKHINLYMHYCASRNCWIVLENYCMLFDENMWDSLRKWISRDHFWLVIWLPVGSRMELDKNRFNGKLISVIQQLLTCIRIPCIALGCGGGWFAAPSSMSMRWCNVWTSWLGGTSGTRAVAAMLRVLCTALHPALCTIQIE